MYLQYCRNQNYEYTQLYDVIISVALFWCVNTGESSCSVCLCCFCDFVVEILHIDAKKRYKLEVLCSQEN